MYKFQSRKTNFAARQCYSYDSHQVTRRDKSNVKKVMSLMTVYEKSKRRSYLFSHDQNGKEK